MLRLVENVKELDFLPADPYAARISALAETYGAEHSFAMFWVQDIDGKSAAGVCRVDGNMTVCCLENTDFEELSAFIDAVGFWSLTCDEKVMEKLGLEPIKTSFTVEYKGGAQLGKIETVRDCDKRKIYDLLCQCDFELGDYHAFLADVCARLNKSTASFAAVLKENIPCACAFALFKGQKSVLLGAVATNPDARGNGYASRLVGMLAEENSSKKVFLFCRNDSLAEFYAKIGFEICGRWAVVENNKE
ncbi:MAG: GNAT family N-acetyltransferase [Clostridia bacterium]|nr:GNAT family N-acetyltransferase [Clostridia bacterium]